MTQEHDNNTPKDYDFGFPREILGEVDSQSTDLGASVTTQPKPPENQKADPFVEQVRAAIADGSIYNSTLEWMDNNKGQISEAKGYTKDEVKRFHMLLGLKRSGNLPHEPGDTLESDLLLAPAADDSQSLEDSGAPTVDQGVEEDEVIEEDTGSSGRTKDRWSMHYNIAKKQSRVLGQIIASNASGNTAAAQALQDEQGFNGLSMDEVEALKKQIDEEIDGMDREVVSFINESQDRQDRLDRIEDKIDEYKRADNATKREELRKEVEGLINGIRVVGLGALNEKIRERAQDVLYEEKKRIKDEFNQTRKDYETSHQEILNRIKSPEINLGDEIRDLSPLEQYNFLDHLVRELEGKATLPTIEQMPEQLRLKIETVMGWISGIENGIDVPIKKEVAEVLGARIRLDQTWKAVEGLNPRDEAAFKSAAADRIGQLVNKGRLFLAKDVAIIKGAIDNGLLLPFGEVYRQLEQSAINKRDPRPSGKWSAGGMKEPGARIDFFEHSTGMQGNLVDTDESINGLNGVFSKQDAETIILMAERTMYVTGETFVANTTGSDPLSALANFKASREATIVKMSGSGTTGDPGPKLTVNSIQFLITSADRRLMGEDGKYLFHPEVYDQAIREAQVANGNKESLASAYNTLTRVTMVDPGNVRANLLVSDAKIDYLKAPPGYLAEYWKNYIPNGIKASDILLKSTWKPGELLVDKIDGIISCFSNLDPTIAKTGGKQGQVGLGVMMLPRQLVRGILSEAVSDGMDPESDFAKGWIDAGQVASLLRRIVSERMLSDDNLKAILKETSTWSSSKRAKFLTDLGLRG